MEHWFEYGQGYSTCYYSKRDEKFAESSDKKIKNKKMENQAGFKGK